MACNYVEIDDCPQGSRKVNGICMPCSMTGGNATTATGNQNSNIPWWQVIGGVLTGAADVIDSVKGNNNGQANGVPIVIQNTPPASTSSNTGLVVGLVAVGLLALGAVLYVVMKSRKGNKG